jgi:hypothetical protein
MADSSVITRRRLLAGVAAIVLLGLAVAGALPGLTAALVYLLPALLLLLALAARRYPGEQALLALMVRGRRRRSHVDALLPRPYPRALLPRGGRLIATSLAVRPPPARRAVALS